MGDYYCEDHPHYKAKRKPTHISCPACWSAYWYPRLQKITLEDFEQMFKDFERAVIEEEPD